MKKLMAIILIMMLGVLAACGGIKPEKAGNLYLDDDEEQGFHTAFWKDGTPFTPVLRFVVASDTHIHDEYLPWTEPRLENLFSDAYAYSRTQEYSKLDAVVIVGDTLETGTTIQHERYTALWQKGLKADETAFLSVFAGHEMIDGTPEMYKEYTSNEPAMHVKINGFHFLTVSVEYSKDPLPYYGTEWLDREMRIAAEDGGDRPIFVFQHHPVPNTITASEKEPPLSLKDILYKYRQTVYFSGHLHRPIMMPGTIYQDEITMIHTGSTFYTYSSDNIHEGDENPGTTPYDTASAGMHIVEVDEFYRIRIMPYDLVMRRFVRSPSSYKDNQLIYYIQNAADKSTFLYTDKRKETADIPVFADGTVLTASQTGAGTVCFTFDEALDGEYLYMYKVEVLKKSDGQLVKRKYIWSGWHRNPRPPYCKSELNGLAPGEYTLRITAEDFFGKSSEPITADFTIV